MFTNYCVSSTRNNDYLQFLQFFFKGKNAFFNVYDLLFSFLRILQKRVEKKNKIIFVARTRIIINSINCLIFSINNFYFFLSENLSIIIRKCFDHECFGYFFNYFCSLSFSNNILCPSVDSLISTTTKTTNGLVKTSF